MAGGDDSDRSGQRHRAGDRLPDDRPVVDAAPERSERCIDLDRENVRLVRAPVANSRRDMVLIGSHGRRREFRGRRDGGRGGRFSHAVREQPRRVGRQPAGERPRATVPTLPLRPAGSADEPERPDHDARELPRPVNDVDRSPIRRDGDQQRLELHHFHQPIDQCARFPVVHPISDNDPDRAERRRRRRAANPASDQNFETVLSNATGGFNLLDRVDIFNLLCVPGETSETAISNMQAYCAKKRAMLIVDPPQTATASGLNSSGPAGTNPGAGSRRAERSELRFLFPVGLCARSALGNRPTLFPPCGFVAGIYARDGRRREASGRPRQASTPA